jgi:hypothetical protein
MKGERVYETVVSGDPEGGGFHFRCSCLRGGKEPPKIRCLSGSNLTFT